jgi:hypothetical protein
MRGGVFCDWLSIYQVHWQGVPMVNAGHVFSVDHDGVIQWDVPQKVVHRGSHDTSIRIRSDGFRVSLEGNIGRFNRADNLFGYTVEECVQLANKLLAELEIDGVSMALPPFTDAAPMPLIRKGGECLRQYDEDGKLMPDAPVTATMLSMKVDNDAGFQAVGAVITRVDLTCNWATGSPGNCEQYIRYLQGFKSGRQEPRSYKTTGVAWGEGSKYWYAKVYDKAAEYYRQCGKGSKKFEQHLFDYMASNGIARHEISLKSRYLKQNNLWRVTQWDTGMDTENRVYALFNDVIGGDTPVDSFLEIPGRAGELAVAWRDGADLKKRLAQNTYYRYRRELLKYGIDIAVPSNVTRLRQRVEVITLAPASPPSWYDLPRVA